MRKLMALAVIAALVLGAAPRVFAQEQEAKREVVARQAAPPPPPPREAAETPVKINVTFSEWDGEKKISSIPYTLSTVTQEGGRELTASVRMGIRVPIFLGSREGGESAQVQYMDVGTDIDCGVRLLDDGRFRVRVVARRNSIYTSDESRASGAISSRPVLRNFSSEFIFFLRPGQSGQDIMATDPQSGRVQRIDVTLQVVK
jgi:hypothetical protein